jgi:hypothetical protein
MYGAVLEHHAGDYSILMMNKRTIPSPTFKILVANMAALPYVVVYQFLSISTIGDHVGQASIPSIPAFLRLKSFDGVTPVATTCLDEDH